MSSVVKRSAVRSLAPTRSAWPSGRDWLIAGTVTLIAQAEVWTSDGYEPKSAYALAALAMTLPLAWHRVAPIAVLVVAFSPLFVMQLAGRSLDSAYVMAVLLVAFFAVGAYCGRATALLGLATGVGLLLALLLVENVVAIRGQQPPAVGDFVFLAVILSAVWALAGALRERSLRAGELEQRAETLEREREERARAAVAEERARIARELHDVVAHSISVIAIQTGSIRRRLRDERPGEARELVVTEQIARQALAEMRRMLGLLRADEDGASLAPQPGLDQLETLISHVREAGLEVELETQGDERSLPPGIDLAAYRILQEALTNVLKHAGHARVRVNVRYSERELELEVTDDGSRVDESLESSAVDGGAGGHGLIGMRERVLLYGGSLETGPAEDGGFKVRAELPVPAA